MSATASQMTSLAIVYSTVHSRRRSKKTSKPRITGLGEGNSPVTGEFPAQRASKAENVSIWSCHHGRYILCMWTFYAIMHLIICGVMSLVSALQCYENKNNLQLVSSTTIRFCTFSDIFCEHVGVNNSIFHLNITFGNINGFLFWTNRTRI